MALAAEAAVALDEKRRRRHDLLAQLREVDHWRRLVTARLDLAVAAVTAIDDPTLDPCGAASPLPQGLREILGLPGHDRAALPEAAVLIRLRAAQRDLDEYARSLRASTDLATLELAALLDAERSGPQQGVPAGKRPAGTRSGGHLRLVREQGRCERPEDLEEGPSARRIRWSGAAHSTELAPGPAIHPTPPAAAL